MANKLFIQKKITYDFYKHKTIKVINHKYRFFISSTLRSLNTVNDGEGAHPAMSFGETAMLSDVFYD